MVRPLQVPSFACGCCRLPQPRPVDKATGVTARVCAGCTHHQGDQDVKRVQRAESHERMLRERLDACRASEAKAARRASAADAVVSDARQATAAALASRGRLAARIVDAAAENPGHRCAAMQLARDPDVIRWGRQAQARELDDDLNL